MTLDTRSILRTRQGAIGRPLARPPVPATPPTPEFVLRFAHGSTRLPAMEIEALQRWTADWLDQEPNGMFVMGCSAPGHRSARVERLRTLRTLLARQGISEERIRYTGDAIEPTPDDTVDGASGGTARLRLIRARHAERQVCSIQSLFKADSGSREAACTSAS